MLIINIIELALLVALASATVYCVRSHHRHRTPADEMFERGKTIGAAVGYEAGRRAGRPTVVPLRCEHCGEPTSKAS